MHRRQPELWALGRLFWPHRRPMLLGAFLGWLAVAAGIGLLALAGWFLTAAAMAGLTAATAALFNFFLPSVGVRLFAFARTLARYGERLVSHDATFRILESLRVWCFRRMIPLVPAVLARYRSGDLLSRLVEDIDTLDNLFLRFLAPGAVALVVTVMLGALLWAFDPSLALCALVLLFLAGALVPYLVARRGVPLGRDLAQQSTGLRSRIVESLQGLPELLVYRSDAIGLDTVHRESRDLLQTQYRMSRLTGMSTAILTLVAGLGLPAVLYLGAGALEEGRLNGAHLALATLAVAAAFEAVWPLPGAFQYLERTRKAGQRLLEVAHTPPPVSFADRTPDTPQRIDLSVEDLGFSYPGAAAPAIAGVRFHIGPGRRVALLGASGCGKSTIVHLLTRFWDPQTGGIRIGGIDLRDFTESDLRRTLTVVSQQPHIFHTTLRRNLLLAKPDASEAELREALAAAKLLAFAQSLPRGLDTLVGETGRLLSGGQVRRLAVARAFLHDGPIWVLDEPTEGLDPVTAEALVESILDRTAGRILLWVTHRRIDFARMDRIVLLEAGRVAAEGCHNELLANNIHYQLLHSTSELV